MDKQKVEAQCVINIISSFFLCKVSGYALLRTNAGMATLRLHA